MLSGATYDPIRAPVAGDPEPQSKTLPEMGGRGTTVPVKKKVAAQVLRTLPQISATPFCIITVYAVFGRQPLDGFTPMASRCHEALGAPLRGEMRKRSANEVTAAGRSDTTSSNWKSTSLGLTPTVPESGVMATICGAATSGGPPGGIPGEAHASPSSATATSRRKALSPFQPADHAA